MKTTSNQLFDRWILTYQKHEYGFHRDGIIDESQFDKERHRILFVMAEPNSRYGNYDHFIGMDLRELFGKELHSKMLTRNLALWTRALLDGVRKHTYLTADEVRSELRRIAVMNLKKFSGTSEADYAAIGLHAWHDRAFIREQVDIISPSLILTCGEKIHKLFGAVMHDDRFWSTETNWKWKGVSVKNIQHPATRGKHTLPAFHLICEIARELK